MGKVKKPNPVKLVVGLIFKEEPALNKAELILKNKFGSFDYESIILPFNFTDYYEAEFGQGLKKKFLGFSKLIYPQELAKIKLFTNKIESKLSRNGFRYHLLPCNPSVQIPRNGPMNGFTEKVYNH